MRRPPRAQPGSCGAGPDQPAPGLRHLHLRVDRAAQGGDGQPCQRRSVVCGTQAQYQLTADDTCGRYSIPLPSIFRSGNCGGAFYGGQLIIVAHHTSRNPEAFYRLLDPRASHRPEPDPQRLPSAHCGAGLEQSDVAQPALRHLWRRSAEFQSLKPWIECNGLNDTRLINMYGITEITSMPRYRSSHRRRHPKPDKPVTSAIR